MVNITSNQNLNLRSSRYINDYKTPTEPQITLQN